MRPWLLTVLLSIGCGVAARPLSSRGTTVDAAALADGSQTAWFRCGKPRYRNAPPLPELARYGSCAIVVAPALRDAQTLGNVPVSLGRVEHLSKTDPGKLVKALALRDQVHVVVRHRQRETESTDPYVRDPDATPQHPACRCRGMPNDFDCRPEGIATLLADERVEEVEIWNRYWVRWK